MCVEILQNYFFFILFYSIARFTHVYAWGRGHCIDDCDWKCLQELKAGHAVQCYDFEMPAYDSNWVPLVSYHRILLRKWALNSASSSFALRCNDMKLSMKEKCGTALVAVASYPTFRLLSVSKRDANSRLSSSSYFTLVSLISLVVQSHNLWLEPTAMISLLRYFGTFCHWHLICCCCSCCCSSMVVV